MLKRPIISLAVAGLLLFTGASIASAEAGVGGFANTTFPSVIFSSQAALPRRAPERALAPFGQRADHQFNELPSYAAVTRITAELPQSKQRGVFELERRYAAPKTLQFVPVQFSGDGFVKHNVINRLLQQEVDRTEKQNAAQTAITERNYKFTYKGESEIDGRSVHDYSVKQRTPVPGLVNGHVYPDYLTDAILRSV